ncbi:MAG: hypothetical protein AAF081_13595 [Actinomycetota bacterium]
MAPSDPPDLDRLEITTANELWSWLDANHHRDAGVLLVTWKAKHRDRYVSRDEVLDALLAHGWIDGRRYALDASRTMQLISPRRHQNWTESYRTRAERLTDEGQMRPPGSAAVAAAKAAGAWDHAPVADHAARGTKVPNY